MSVQNIFLRSEERITGHRDDFIVDTTKDIARFEGCRVMCAVEF
jgi:hypothetical protein